MAVVAQYGNPANTPKLFRKLNSIGWSGCPERTDQLLLKGRVASFH
jgi:hypothetical protein